jgi:CheY-like chemotaxis protein
MVTSKGNDDDQGICFAAGCNHFLTKPLDRDQFLEVARRFLPAVDRREKRQRVSIDASFRANDAMQTCRMLDISIGGAFLATEFFGMPKSVIHLTFSLPDGTAIDTPCRIAWVNRVATPKLPKGFGVKFALLPKNLNEALDKFVDSE